MGKAITAGAKRKKTDITPYLFIAPQIILFIVFFLVPACMGIYAAFTRWNILSNELPTFVGLDNFKEIFLNAESTYYKFFRAGFKNTVTFVLLSVPFCIVLPLIMALAINKKPWGHKFFQSLFYMPTVLSISTVILIWYYMFNKNLGLINNFFHLKVNWVGAQPYAWFAIVLVTVWWTIGQNLVIYLAALNGVSQDLLEAAEVDGAGPARKFFNIMIPSIRNQLAYTFVLTTVAQFNIYGQPLMLTGGGPNNSTNVLLMVIRDLAFPSYGGNSISGLASAMALVMGSLMIVIALLQYRFIGEKE
ncbi:MAG: sugar ABC transporter permease [Lachnospiraceae bacterium]|nr:sugar ABC transporter permease [Lachnospiraceae bacterium]